MKKRERWVVIATEIESGRKRLMGEYESEASAEACVRMAVMRRGVDVEFFTAMPESEAPVGLAADVEE